MTMRDLLGLGVIAAAVAIGTGACGGGGGSGGSGGGAGSSGASKSASTIAINGVPSSKKLSELTKDEAVQVCKAISDGVDHALSDADAARLTCTLFAALTSGTAGAGNTIKVNATACAKSVNDCVAQASGTATTQSSCDPATAMSDLMSCDATVAQLQTCLNATVAQIQEVFHMFTCEKLAASGVPQSMLSSAQGSASVPQCADLQARCPNLQLGGNSASSSSSSGPSGKPAANGCDDTCFFSDDGECDDGGKGSASALCALGTDCKDCGKR